MVVTKKDMLKILQATDFPKNTGRANVLKKGQTFSQSMVLGKVRKLYSSCNGKICLVESRHNKKIKAVLKAAKALLKQHAPGYRPQALTINKNHAAAKHTDKCNNPPSYIIGLGNFTGGELVFSDKTSPHYGTHNIKNKFLKFDESTEHYVKPFKGERYTVVYYRWS
jgi:hypothetical protein